MASALGNKSNVRLVGLDLIRLADHISSTGAMVTSGSLTTIGNVVPDSAHLIITAPTQTEIYIEEEDTPDLILNNTGQKYSVEFALRDMGTKTLLAGLNGTAAAGVWSAPVTAYPVNERCLEVTSKTINGKKLKFEIPRASMAVGGDLKFARTDTGALTFAFNVMQPNSSTQLSPLVVTQV